MFLFSYSHMDCMLHSHNNKKVLGMYSVKTSGYEPPGLIVDPG